MEITYYFVIRFSFKASIINSSECCPVKHERLSVTTLPALLKTRSEGTLVPGEHKYFLASINNFGKQFPCNLHHSNGLLSMSIFGSIMYFLNSSASLSS